MSETKIVDASEIEEDVEQVEPKDCQKMFRVLLWRFLLSLVFIGACAGAVIYSFVHGEKGTHVHEHHRDASKNFSIFVDQYSKKKGLYIVTYKYPDGSRELPPRKEKFHSIWYQSNTNQTLVHQVTQDITIYAFKTHAYWYDTSNKKKICTFDPNTNYMSYINRLGLTSLERYHSEYEETHNGNKVFIYQGNPSEVLLTNVQQTAFLVTAYADSKTGALLAWDTYFTAKNQDEDLIYKTSYEYSSMLSAKPDDSWFITPEECSP
ncbi:unnamed protein product [Caenorhabditis bovis]|uniref:Uncharacterized protein n=1 Tax=Caenorhabditis bovis TaxID=2654633 RepID=A0A8S1ELA2_9PELO|nr:unnamed protein product [Caenorhabditis bovis]